VINTLSNQRAVEDRRSAFNAEGITATPEGISEENRPRVLTDVLRIAETTCGDQVKVVSSTQRLSYAEIGRYSDRLASRLVAHDVNPGDRVVIGLPNSTEFIIACFAVWKARGVVVAIDHHAQAENLRSILERTEPVVLIAEANFAEKIQEMPVPLRSFRAFFLKNGCTDPSATGQISVESFHSAIESDAELANLPVVAQPDDLATITFTSGSTNVPKGVMHTHESILACASFTLSYLQLSRDDVMMLPLPLHHVLAFRRFLTCFLAQCTLVLASDIFMMRQFSTARPTGLVLVPSACDILIDKFADFFHKQGECLRYVEIGSEPISGERLHALQTILPNVRVHLTYGLTEGRVGYLRAGSNGVFDRLDRSNQGVEIAVVDADGDPVGEGETGEILIFGSGLFKGYWGDSVATQTQWKEAGFRTGDLGIVDENGRIRLAGRIDDIIKIGGHKINPREIETVLQRHPAVAEAVVTGRVAAQGDLGNALQAFVVCRKGFVASDIELLAYCREHLELYKVPATIHFRVSLPKTSLGKIQRHIVAQSY